MKNLESREIWYITGSQLRTGGARYNSLRDGARIELGLRGFLETGTTKSIITLLLPWDACEHNRIARP